MKKIIIFLVVSFLIIYSNCQMTGGWTNQGTNDFEGSLNKVIDFLVKNISDSNVNSEKWIFDTVLSYQTQVVAGINHKLVIQIKNNAGDKKVVFAKVFQSLAGIFEVNRLIKIVSSKDNSFNTISSTDILDDLKKKIVKVQGYYSGNRVQYNIRKIKWCLSLINENNQEIYYINYELEGTNNEISLWEHWFVKGNEAIDSSLYFIKLPIAKYDFNEFLYSKDQCSTIRSYVLCGLSNCSNKAFISDGKCKDQEILN